MTFISALSATVLNGVTIWPEELAIAVNFPAIASPRFSLC
jgi:hypothetical protein